MVSYICCTCTGIQGCTQSFLCTEQLAFAGNQKHQPASPAVETMRNGSLKRRTGRGIQCFCPRRGSIGMNTKSAAIGSHIYWPCCLSSPDFRWVSRVSLTCCDAGHDKAMTSPIEEIKGMTCSSGVFRPPEIRPGSGAYPFPLQGVCSASMQLP